MKTKSKIVLSAILTILLCASVITGATLALFTSESKVNIAIGSGTVEVVASIDETSISLSSLGADRTAEGTFANGGTVVYDGSANKLTLTNITPGDRIEFPILMSNNSNVSIKARIKIAIEGDSELKNNLLFGFEQAGGSYYYVESWVTAWIPLSVGEQIGTSNVAIELPAYVGSLAQNKTCSATVVVEAIQGNATVADEEAIKLLKVLEDPADFATAVDAISSEQTVILGGNDASVWENATLDINNTNSGAIINIRGWKVGTLNVNVPDGEVHVYNDADAINGEHVAHNSLHVYGKIDNLVVKQGRVVVEAVAEVEKVTIIATANEIAKVEVLNEVPVVEVAPESAGTAIVLGEVAETIVPEDKTLVQGSLATEDVATVYDVATEAQLRKAIGLVAEGESIRLVDDLFVNSSIGITKYIVLDMNGFDIHMAKARVRLQVQGDGSLEIKGSGTLVEDAPYFGPIVVKGKLEDSTVSRAIIIGKDVTLKGWAGLFIDAPNKTYADLTNYADLNIQVDGTLVGLNDGTYNGFGLYVNGGVGTADQYPVINIGSTAVLDSTGLGIYAAGYSHLTIDGAQITGQNSAIEIRAGILDIKDGVFTATAEEFDAYASDSGSSIEGAAIAVSQHTTEHPIAVTIYNGEFNGTKALYENDFQNKPESSGVSISILGGTFNGAVESVNGKISSKGTLCDKDGNVVGQIDCPYAQVNEIASKEVGVVYDISDRYGETTPLVLDTAYIFKAVNTAEQAQISPYRYWHADFVVSVDSDISADSIVLAGQYNVFHETTWVALQNTETPYSAGAQLRLLEIMDVTMNYEELCTYVKTFQCGAVDISDLSGVTLTVELRLYETEEPSEANYYSRNVETGNYVVIGAYSYTF